MGVVHRLSNAMGLPADAPPPRLCHVIKRPDFSGYGFNLHAERSRPGQFIGKVDPGSPAEMSGLREGDRIVEVNGVNITQENHKQVVQRIKAIPNETKLLVIDKVGEDMYKKAGVVIRSSMVNTVTQCSEDINGNNSEEVLNREIEDQESNAVTNSISSTENNKDQGNLPAKVEEDETPPPYEEVSAAVENAEAEKKPEEEEQELSDELRKNSLETPQIVETVEEEQNEVHLEESPTKDIECNIQHVEVTVEQVPDEIPEPQVEPKESIEDIEPKIKEVKNEIVEPSEVIFEPSEAKMDEKLESKEEPVAQESEELEDSLEFTDEHHNNNNNEVDDEEVKSPIVLPPTEKPMSVSSSDEGSSSRTTPSPVMHQHHSTLERSDSDRTDWDGLSLNLSAREMRERIGSKKKADPRKEKLDMRKKYDIIQTL